MSVRQLFGIFFILISCAVSLAQSKDKDFSVGADEENSKTYLVNSPSAIQMRIAEEVAKQCNTLGCTIAAVEKDDHGWTFSLSIGNGNNLNNSGNTFIIGTPNSSNNSDSNYVNVSVIYKNEKCSTELKIQKEWYMTLTAYGAYARDEAGKPVPVAKPDTRFFALVYTSLVDQVKQAGCSR